VNAAAASAGVSVAVLTAPFFANTIIAVDIEFDAGKDAANLAKHGVSLADAALLDWDLMLCRADTRRDYGDLREVGYAPIGARVYCVVFVQRGDVFRIVSLRKANGREVNGYDQALQALRVCPPDA
jgi:uncharacterized DUF497 family protein